MALDGTQQGDGEHGSSKKAAKKWGGRGQWKCLKPSDRFTEWPDEMHRERGKPPFRGDFAALSGFDLENVENEIAYCERCAFVAWRGYALY